jgi:hypothetical protein
MTELSEAKRFRVKEEAAKDGAAMKTSCAFCNWSFEGPTVTARAKATEHREKKHPEIQPKRRRHNKPMLHTFRHPGMDDEHKDEIQRERMRRARLHGIEIED